MGGDAVEESRVEGLKNRAEIHGALLKERADVAWWREMLDGRLAGLGRFIQGDGLLKLTGAGRADHATLLVGQRDAMEAASVALKRYAELLEQRFALVQAEATAWVESRAAGAAGRDGVDIDAVHRRVDPSGC